MEAPETWHFSYLDDETDFAVGRMYAEADTLLLGRKTYETFAAAWPHREGGMADAVNGIRKPVASTTLTGSISLTRTLLTAGLVDELRLLVHPVMPGAGLRLFPEGLDRVPLRLARPATFASGVLDLTYRPA